MNKAEFDAVADEYLQLHSRNISASGESPEFFARYKIEDVAREARKRAIDAREILDFGSGIGNSLPHFQSLFPQATVTCADVSTRSLSISQKRFPDAKARYTEVSESRLPLPDESIDISFSACVFHHIAHSEHVAWLEEIRRVTRPGGMLIVYEHNPLNPLTVSAVRNCAFDQNARLIHSGAFLRRLRAAGWQRSQRAYRMFFPHALAFARPAERWLRRVPLGAQYFVTAIRD
ncbi:MAG: class I SAM-dependent methyltransferase [Rhizobacter sp.]